MFIIFMQNRSVIVSPVIDIIDKDTMAYTTASPVVKGGFDPNLHFKWDTMSHTELRSRNSPVDPIQTPAIAGGLFAVDKKWFHHIGEYDSQMEIWGAENVGMLSPYTPPLSLGFFFLLVIRVITACLDVWRIYGDHPLLSRGSHLPISNAVLLRSKWKLPQHSGKVSTLYFTYYGYHSNMWLHRNIRRTVEVWLDEYKDYFYENNVYSRNIPYGE